MWRERSGLDHRRSLLHSPRLVRHLQRNVSFEWQTLLKNTSSQGIKSGRNGPSSSALAGSCDGHSFGPVLGSQTTGRRAKARLKGFTDPDLLDIESHSPTLTRDGFVTVLRSVCSHGHKLQSGDVQQAFDTWGPDQEREQPLFVRMPPDGVPGGSREVWVQLLKTVDGLANGTRKWRNGFLATARGLGFETSVLEPCVLVLRGSQQRYHGIRDEVWEQTFSKLIKRFTFGHRDVGKGTFYSREVVQAADRSMRVGQPA